MKNLLSPLVLLAFPSLAACVSDGEAVSRSERARDSFERGKGFTGGGRHAEALPYYERAIELDPEFAPAHHFLAISLVGAGRAEDAIAAFDRAIELNPSKARVYVDRGWALTGLGRFEEALANYERALSVDPGQSEAYFNRGRTLARMGHHEEAIASYERAEELRASFHGAIRERGVSLHAVGLYGEALQAFEGSLRAKEGGNSRALLCRARTLIELGRMEEAGSDLLRAIELRGGYPEAEEELEALRKRSGRG